jgi:hypothetical protein
MRRCEIWFSKILKTQHSLVGDIPCREEMICMSGILVLIVAKSVLAIRGIVLGIMTWIIDGKPQLDDGGENT